MRVRLSLLTGITFTKIKMVNTKQDLLMKTKNYLMTLQEECLETKSMGLVSKSCTSLFAKLKATNSGQ